MLLERLLSKKMASLDGEAVEFDVEDGVSCGVVVRRVEMVSTTDVKVVV